MLTVLACLIVGFWISVAIVAIHTVISSVAKTVIHEIAAYGLWDTSKYFLRNCLVVLLVFVIPIVLFSLVVALFAASYWAFGYLVH